eukprot:scaffold7372_cov123-Isochrysis_galbana.AAC.1
MEHGVSIGLRHRQSLSLRIQPDNLRVWQVRVRFQRGQRLSLPLPPQGAAEEAAHQRQGRAQQPRHRIGAVDKDEHSGADGARRAANSVRAGTLRCEEHGGTSDCHGGYLAMLSEPAGHEARRKEGEREGTAEGVTKQEELGWPLLLESRADHLVQCRVLTHSSQEAPVVGRVTMCLGGHEKVAEHVVRREGAAEHEEETGAAVHATFVPRQVPLGNPVGVVALRREVDQFEGWGFLGRHCTQHRRKAIGVVTVCGLREPRREQADHQDVLRRSRHLALPHFALDGMRSSIDERASCGDGPAEHRPCVA